MSLTPNQYTGRYAPGFRFCFHVQAIAHRSRFLPIEMKSLPEIQRLLKGESPLSVFNCNSIPEARNAFCELRKKYDFPFWAVTEYRIRDIKDPDIIIPFRLNSIQYYIIDILQKRYQNRRISRYVITKTFGRCGVTTCVQAYILWLQTYRCRNNSFTCASSAVILNQIKTDLCRHLHRDVIPADPWIFLPVADRTAYFNTFRNPDFIRGINLGYVHFADMSKWKDSQAALSARVLSAATSAVLLDPSTLVVMEGNLPRRFNICEHQYFHLPLDFRIELLAPISNCPLFLDYVARIHHRSNPDYLVHIDLDILFTRISPLINITLP